MEDKERGREKRGREKRGREEENRVDGAQNSLALDLCLAILLALPTGVLAGVTKVLPGGLMIGLASLSLCHRHEKGRLQLACGCKEDEGQVE